MNKKLLKKIESGEVTITEPICLNCNAFGVSSNGRDLKYDLTIYHPDGTIEENVRAYGVNMIDALERVTKTRRREAKHEIVVKRKKKINNFWIENQFIIVLAVLLGGVSAVNALSVNGIYTIYSLITAVILAIGFGIYINRNNKD